MNKLDKLAATFNAQNVNRLQAMIVGTLHGFNDIENNPIAQHLRNLVDQLARHSLMLHLDMPEALPKYRKVMEHFMSVESYGDQHLGLMNGFKSCIARLEADGKDQKGYDRTFYANDVLATLVSGYLLERPTVHIYGNGSVTDAPMRGFKGFSGIVANVQSDIPNHGRESVFVVGKVLNEMESWLNDLPRKKFEKEGSYSTMAHHIDELRDTVSKVVQSYNNMASAELEGYRKYWDRDTSRDQEKTIDF